MPKTLIDLISALPRAQVIGTHGDLGTPITAPVVESDAEVLPGGVFVARQGLSIDGHTFIPAAIERGAAAIVGEHDLGDLPVPYVRVHTALEATGWLAAAYYGFPARRLVIIGVTGKGDDDFDGYLTPPAPDGRAVDGCPDPAGDHGVAMSSMSPSSSSSSWSRIVLS